MAISGNLTINIGLPNESAGSDSLYTAFTKVNTNFNRLFANASKVVAGNGITITENPSNSVISANLIAGNNIVLTNSEGAIIIESIGGGGNGGGNITGVIAGTGLAGGGFSGNVVLALQSSGVTAGVYYNPTLTIDQYGRVLVASNNAVAGTVTSVGISPGVGIGVAGGPITSNGSITVTNTGVTRLTAGTGITLSNSTGNIQISATGGGGGVTSVGISSSQLVVSGSPIVGAGTITINLPNNISLTGNISAGNSVSANYFVGNGYFLTGLNPSNIVANTANYAAFAGNVTIAAQPNITSVGTLTSLAVSGNISASNLGNISSINLDGNASNVLHGDGTWSADITNYGNSNVAAYLPTYTGNLTAGNASLGNAVTANYFIGNFYGTANTATTAGTVTTAAQPNITSVGTLSSLTVTANTTTGGIKTDNYYYANGVSISFAGSYSNSNVAAYLPTYTGNITAGNVYANSGTIGAQILKGEGGNISNVQGANVSGQVSFAATANAVAGANVSGQVANALVAGTVYTAAQPNITSLGTLTGLGVNGNITAANITANTGVFTGNGSGLTNLAGANVSGQVSFAATANSVAGANVSGQVGNALVAGTVYTAAQPNITSVGTLSSLSVTGNVSSNNVVSNNIVKTTAVAFSSLPLASVAGAGARAFITDGNLVASGNFGATVSNGGANNVPVYSDGTNWCIG